MAEWYAAQNFFEALTGRAFARGLFKALVQLAKIYIFRQFKTWPSRMRRKILLMILRGSSRKRSYIGSSSACVDKYFPAVLKRGRVVCGAEFF